MSMVLIMRLIVQQVRARQALVQPPRPHHLALLRHRRVHVPLLRHLLLPPAFSLRGGPRHQQRDPGHLLSSKMAKVGSGTPPSAATRTIVVCFLFVCLCRSPPARETTQRAAGLSAALIFILGALPTAVCCCAAAPASRERCGDGAPSAADAKRRVNFSALIA